MQDSRHTMHQKRGEQKRPGSTTNLHTLYWLRYLVMLPYECMSFHNTLYTQASLYLLPRPSQQQWICKLTCTLKFGGNLTVCASETTVVLVF